MIKIADKSYCCGCSACAQRCPKQCISMIADNEGFLYPHVDTNACIACHMCEQVCPMGDKNKERTPLEVYAAKNADNNVRMESSSGGLFSMLAEQTIEAGGVVFGARWDEDWNVKHDYTETRENIYKFRCSKYLQSIIGNSFLQAEMFLKAGRKVMFTGTPCQIAGLKHFLRKEYDNLLTVDVVCHSVPSPGVWQKYLSEKLEKLKWNKSDILHISFRNKKTGWKNYSFSIENNQGDIYTELGSRNSYMQGFLAGLYTRPSCYACPVKKLKSGSDITLGDLWSIESLMPEIYDDKGVSAVVVNTEKGKANIAPLKIQLYSLRFQEVAKHNSALISSAIEPKNRAMFFEYDGRTFEKKNQEM